MNANEVITIGRKTQVALSAADTTVAAFFHPPPWRTPRSGWHSWPPVPPQHHQADLEIVVIFRAASRYPDRRRFRLRAAKE